MLSGTDYVKTIVNGLKQWVKKQIRAARPDWNQNDPKAPNYIENRIAYVDTHITHAINPEPFDRENSWQKFSGFMLEKGKTYHITVNGRRYTCVARLFIPNDMTHLIVVGWQLAGIDRGYDDVPFCIYNRRDRVGGECCALCSGDDRNLYVEEYTRTFTDIKQLPEECVPHAPIYLTAPTDEDLCNAILGADGSIVMVTTASGATQVFYPCHESVTEPRTWVGTAIGGEYDETCIYKVVVPPTGLPSIKYSAGRSSAPIYDLVKENDAYVFYRHEDRTTPITDYSNVATNVARYDGTIYYNNHPYRLHGSTSYVGLVFKYIDYVYHYMDMVESVIEVNRRYNLVSVNDREYSIIPKLVGAKVGQVLKVESVSVDKIPSGWVLEDEGVIPSSTPNSTKKFKITVDDSGVISAMEVVE